MDEDSLKKARNRLAAGRIRAIEKAPYLATSLLSLTPKEVEGFGTFAVDKRWIIYYDPQCCLDWNVDEIAAVWLHEINHVLRDHAGRFSSLGDPNKNAEYFNYAADAAINSDLRDMEVVLPDPDRRWYAEPNPTYPDWRRNMTAEEMYSIAKGSSNGNPDEDKDGKGDNSEDVSEASEDGANENTDSKAEDQDENSDDASSSDEDNSTEDEDNEADSNNSSDESTDENQDNQDEANNSEESNDSEGDNGSTMDEDDSSSEDVNSDEADGSPQDSDSDEKSDGEDGSPGDPGKDGENDTQEGSEGSSEGPEDNSGTGTHDPHSNCGSGAHGIPQDYEVDDGSGMDPMESEQMRREAAQEINSYNERYGTVPGGLVKEAKKILEPQVDWTEELLAVVRKEIAMIVGQSDYTYSRPSRRHSQSQFVMPSMRQAPPPEIVIVLDTSGSMAVEKELAQALGEMEDLVDRAAHNSPLGGIRIINCDAGANIPVIVSDLNDFVITGGGGTDMRIGIKAASELDDPPAGIIITMTDGFTPWPKEIPEDNEDAFYIALIIDTENLRENPRKRGWSTTGIPEWMTVIDVHTQG